MILTLLIFSGISALFNFRYLYLQLKRERDEALVEDKKLDTSLVEDVNEVEATFNKDVVAVETVI